MNIGICILATNRYFLLGLRFIHKWMIHYKGSSNITFYLFTDTDPTDYIDTNNIVHHYSFNEDWVSGANSKFENILKLREVEEDYLFFFDADTNINKPFTERWFIGSSVGGQHFGDQVWMKDNKDYDRNPESTAYVPYDTDLDQMYYYGAFFGGSKDHMISLCQTMFDNQLKNKEIGHEPIYNDESYLNKEYHYSPPRRIIPTEEFKFIISDKGSINKIRDVKSDFSSELIKLKTNKNRPFDLKDGMVEFL